MSNSENPKNGALFQRQVKEWFQKRFNTSFELEKKLPIGDPAKNHKFDIVNQDNTIAIECKRYTWTGTGNVPSAKMGFTNEAAFYLTFLPDSFEKFIVMLYSFNEKRGETLAEYYYRINRHLLGNIRIAEYNPDNNQMRIIGEELDINSKEMKWNLDQLKDSVFSTDSVIQAIDYLQERITDIAKYCDLLQWSSTVNVAEDKDFQTAFTAFFRLRRDSKWREHYFSLFERQKKRGINVSFGEILLRLFKQCGQIEASFSSKMLATINPEMPIWDSIVLKNLGFKIKGKTKEEKFSNAVVLYDDICKWYQQFKKTDEAKRMLESFDLAFSEYRHISETKKIDFMLWAMR